MFKKRLILALGLAAAWGFAPIAHAGTMVLDSFVDQSPATIDLPATQLLMATVNTSATQGGNDATATAVSIGGTIVAADVAEVCVDYASLQVTCQANPSNLANISLSMGGNQKGGSPFDYRVTLNPSAAGKTIQLTVASITNADMVDNIPLPASTATRTVAGGATPAVVATLPATNVNDVTARLWGEVTTDGSPSVSTCGVDWGTASGGPYSAGSQSVACSGTGQFFVDVSGLTPDTPYYYIAWADNGVRADAPTEQPFTTSPAASLPTVSTRVVPVPSITADSAEMGGNVTADGGAPVTARGVYWQADTPGSENGTQVPMGSGTGEYFQTVSGLPSGKTIYYRAYAVNSAGEQLGNELNFATLAGLPIVDSPTDADIAATTATLGGTMSSNGGEAPSDCGVEWGTTFGGPYPNPGSFGVCSEGVPFTVGVSGLPTGTVVYFRAYATNSAGTAYSEQANFTPAGAPVVTATPATNILLKSATLGGEVTSDGGSNLTGRGIVWDTASPPEAAGTVVPMGNGIGSFSQTVSGLPAGRTIFWKAYASNAIDTGYSGQQQFDTLSEPTVQASNLSFTAAGRSLRINWTRGNGDGAIVVMRLAATAGTAPQDGDDYTGNPDFAAPPPELPVNSNNFVVYKGPGSSVTVTGLTFTTDYTVAVYEYAGTGIDTDYLLTPLVEATQQTTDYAVHNYDYGIACDQCHNHGSFGARDTELKDICLGCHSEFGDAVAKQEFDNHTTPTKNPAVDFVDCGVCHELHNLSATNTTESFNSITSQTQHNKSFLRANVDKYISTAATPAFLHTDQPKREEGNLNQDPVQPAVTPERAVEGGDATTARGYCQVCHTQTNYHRNNAAATDPAGSGRPGLMQCHDGDQNDECAAEVHCGDCHEHNNRFVGVNNNLPCEQCHDQVQGTRPIITTQFDGASKHIPGGSTDAIQANCLVCHDQGGHTGGAVAVWNADDGATSYVQPTPGADTRNTGEGEAFAPHCLSCHDSNGAASLPPTGDQTPSSPFTGTGAPPEIDNALWTNAGHNRPVATFPSTPVTCVGGGANGCHSSGHGTDELNLLAPIPTDPDISAKASIVCTECHKPGGISSKDIRTAFQPDPVAATEALYQTSSGAAINRRHDIFDADQAYSTGAVTCSACHSPHADNATNATVLNPSTKAAVGPYNFGNYGPGQDPLNPEGKPLGGFEELDYIEFCLVCHGSNGGTSPLPGVTMSTGLRNIGIDWANDQHGQGVGGNSNNGYLKYPFNQAGATSDANGAYAALNCTTCHGAHGTGNIFNLRESITVAGEQLTTGGWAGDTIGTLETTTYTLPLVGRQTQKQDHLQWGAWCSFCHQHQAHGRDEDIKCTSGHMHGGNQF